MGYKCLNPSPHPRQQNRVQGQRRRTPSHNAVTLDRWAPLASYWGQLSFMTTYSSTGARNVTVILANAICILGAHVLNWKSVWLPGEESEAPGNQLCLRGRQDAGDAGTNLGPPVLYKPLGFRGLCREATPDMPCDSHRRTHWSCLCLNLHNCDRNVHSYRKDQGIFVDLTSLRYSLKLTKWWSWHCF